MKRKLFMTVIIVLVVCLSCGMLLVACNKKGKNEDKKEDKPTSTLVTTELNEAIDKVISGIDTANKTENGEMAFSVEISRTGSDKSAAGTLFGLGYEKIDGKYYLYASAGGGNYVKINATSMGTLLNQVFDVVDKTSDAFTMVDGYPAITTGDSQLKLDAAFCKTILTTLGKMLFEGAEESVDGAYVLYLDVDKTINNLPSLISFVAKKVKPAANIPDDANLAQTIEALAGLEAGTVDGYVAKYAGYIFKDMEITTLQQLLDYLAKESENIQFKVGFMFDGRVADDKTNPFVDVAGITDTVRSSQSINLLNFSANGTVEGYVKGEDGALTANKNYAIDVDIDINPFALTELLSHVEVGENGKATLKMDKAEISAMLDNLGYLCVTVDEIGEDGKIVKNILTLYYDSADADNLAIAAFQSHSFSGLASLGLGGVYDTDALIDVVTMLVSGSAGTASDAVSAAEKIDVKQLLTTIMGYVDASKISSEGVVVDINGLVSKVMEIVTGSAPQGAAQTAIDSVIGSDVLKIKFSSFKYGGSQKRAYSDLVANLRTNTNSFDSDMNPHTDNDVYVGKITSIPGLEQGAKIGLGSSVTSGLTESQTGQGLPLYIMNGVDLITGKDVVTSGLIMAVKGFDPATLGKQEVTVYVGVLSDFYFAVGAINNFVDPDITLNPAWPLFGVLRYDVTVEVVDPMLEYEAAQAVGGSMFGQYTGDITQIAISAGSAWNKSYDGSFMQIALRTGELTSSVTDSQHIGFTVEDMNNPNAIRITDSEGNNVTEQVIAAGGVIDKAGTYTLLLVKNGYGATVNIVVS